MNLVTILLNWKIGLVHFKARVIIINLIFQRKKNRDIVLKPRKLSKQYGFWLDVDSLYLVYKVCPSEILAIFKTNASFVDCDLNVGWKSIINNQRCSAVILLGRSLIVRSEELWRLLSSAHSNLSTVEMNLGHCICYTSAVAWVTVISILDLFWLGYLGWPWNHSVNLWIYDPLLHPNKFASLFFLLKQGDILCCTYHVSWYLFQACLLTV